MLSAGAGDRAVLQVANGNGAPIAIPIVVSHRYLWGVLWSKLAQAGAFLLLGLFLVWNSRGRTSAFLALYCLLNLPGILNWYSWLPVGDRLLYFTFLTLCTGAANVCLYAFAESFFRDRIGKRIRVTGRILAALGALAPILCASLISDLIERGNAGVATTLIGALMLPLAPLGVLLVSIAGYLRSSGPERLKTTSIMFATIALVGASSAMSVLTFLGADVGLKYDSLANVAYPIIAAVTIAAVVTYAVAVLLQRLLDVSFIVNDVIAYVISIGIFGIAITSVEEFIVSYFESRSAGLAFLFIMIAILSITFSTFHHAVEQTVERILFRQKHESIKALRLYSEDARYIQSDRDLLERTCTTIRSALRVHHVAIYLRHADRYELAEACESRELPDTVNVDDPVFVRLSAHGVDALLNGLHSTVGSEGLAIALAVPDGFFGAIVCGPKLDLTPYNPDDRDALERLAAAVASSLQLLRLKAAIDRPAVETKATPA